jgi:transcriptional regulator with XRE-family HTH domain
MEDLKVIIAKNITNLRLEKGYTQIQLATILNYSDKAVSKWERAESIPDITVLKEIADLFGVTVDYLLTLEHKDEQIIQNETRTSRSVIILLSLMLVWLIATLMFVTLNLLKVNNFETWLSFIYAIPLSSIVWLVLNSIWKNKKFNYFIVSLLMWSIILSIHLTAYNTFDNIWLLYILGAPGQIIIILWANLIKKK